MPPEAPAKTKEKDDAKEATPAAQPKTFSLVQVIIIAVGVLVVGGGAIGALVAVFLREPGVEADAERDWGRTEYVPLDEISERYKERGEGGYDVEHQVVATIWLLVHESDTARNREVLDKNKPRIFGLIQALLTRKSWLEVQSVNFQENFANEIKEILNREFGQKTVRSVELKLSRR